MRMTSQIVIVILLKPAFLCSTLLLVVTRVSSARMVWNLGWSCAYGRGHLKGNRAGSKMCTTNTRIDHEQARWKAVLNFRSEKNVRCWPRCNSGKVRAAGKTCVVKQSRLPRHSPCKRQACLPLATGNTGTKKWDLIFKGKNQHLVAVPP